MKVLLIEDDEATGSALAEILTAHHYTVNLATDGQTGLDLAREFEYDVILLDVMMPKLDGFSVCRQLREEGYQQPILLLTAKDSRSDRILGLDSGADDYVVKPFDPPELLARIRALMRREQFSSSAILSWENLQLDTDRNEVTCGGQPIRLTHKEYCLLELFLLNPKRIFSRSAILDRLWDFAESPGEETVSTHIKCLRQKLKAAGASDLIETVYGLGYRLKALAQSSENSASQATHPPKPEPAQQRTLANTSKIWEKYRDTFIQQAEILESAAQALLNQMLSPDQQQQAKQAAHKLAGSLGIFGVMAGSQLAQELEELLQSEMVLATAQIQQISKRAELLRQVIEQAHTTESKPVAMPYAPLLLVIDDDVLLAEQVRLEAIAWGLRVELATDLEVARKVIAQSPPNVILLDLNFPGTETGFVLLRELMQRSPKLPILAFTGQGDLASRLEVVRLGGCTFLQKPLSTYEILTAVTDVLKQTQMQHFNRVMVVDDDSAITENLADLLQPFGVRVTELNTPQQFWQVLTATTPNVLVLDLEMPNFNGLELCQAVRSDPNWQQLPILFLSTHTDTATIDRAFTAGADDYLSKSTPPAELATRILHRLMRVGFQPVQDTPHSSNS
ncbi:MAG: response regulator [Leptolyngbyaceae cyanobacterium bins.302]|nr:response regulator [Leptolyngbyaceae cyanobacterium bins.302]